MNGQPAAFPPGAGGKAAGLRALAAAGADVPPWSSVPDELFRTFLRDACLEPAYRRMERRVRAGVARRDVDRIERAVARFRDAVLGTVMPTGVAGALGAIAEQHLRPGATVAVRSSMGGEDAEAWAAAGAYATELGVADVRGVVDAVWRGWAAAFDPALVRRRLEAGLAPVEPVVALVVQEMVEPDIAGVLFSADPVSGEPHVLVATTAGRGDSLVDGSGEGSLLRIDRATRSVLAARGTPIPDPQLVERMLFLLAAAERIAHGPADIEWAVRGDRLFALQLRPLRVPSAPLLHGAGLHDQLGDRAAPLTMDLFRTLLHDSQHGLLEQVGGTITPAVERELQGVLVDADGAPLLDYDAWGRIGRQWTWRVPDGRLAAALGWPVPALRSGRVPRAWRTIALWVSCVALAGVRARGLTRRVERLASAPDADGLRQHLRSGAWRAAGAVDLGAALVEVALAPMLAPDAAPAALFDAGALRTRFARRARRSPRSWHRLHGRECMDGMRIEGGTWIDHPVASERLLRSARPPRAASARSVARDADVRGRRRLVRSTLLIALGRRQRRVAEDLRHARALLAGIVRGVAVERVREAGLRVVDVPWLRLDEVLGDAPLPHEDELGARRAAFDATANGAVRQEHPGSLPAGAMPGTACSPGTSSGAVLHVRTAEDLVDVQGRVLVCERLAPDWALLAADSAAVVVRSATPLSHAMIVLRELGVPAVANVDGLPSLQDGAHVVVDGTAGTVVPAAGD